MNYEIVHSSKGEKLYNDMIRPQVGENIYMVVYDGFCWFVGTYDECEWWVDKFGK